MIVCKYFCRFRFWKLSVITLETRVKDTGGSGKCCRTRFSSQSRGRVTGGGWPGNCLELVVSESSLGWDSWAKNSRTLQPNGRALQRCWWVWKEQVKATGVWGWGGRCMMPGAAGRAGAKGWRWWLRLAACGRASELVRVRLLVTSCNLTEAQRRLVRTKTCRS